MSEAPFLKLLHDGIAAGGFQTDDLLNAVLPLFRHVTAWHEAALVAPLQGVAGIAVHETGGLHFEATDGRGPQANQARVDELQKPVSSALRVIGHARVTSDETIGFDHQNLEVISADAPLKHPSFISGYESWELSVGHHDALTDIFCLGQLFASLALGLDFTDAEDLGQFASHRANLFALNARLHPVFAGVIRDMTELNRHERAPDLASLVRHLESYRDQPAHTAVSSLPGFADAGLVSRRRLVQAHLRDRLFEISRRNRLLYHRQTQSSLNLTVASVPLVINLTSIKLEQLFTWHEALATEIADGRPISLGRWLRFEDQPYLPASLDRLIADARRDRAEFGFAQLRLVIAFLHWHNLKEAPQERIITPLLLLPVEVSKKKGVRDQYILEPTSTEAETNPVLRHHLHQLYGLRLPESVDLRETKVQDFHREIEEQIRASEPGVSVRYVDQPEIRVIHERARQRLAQFQRRQKLRAPGRRTKASFDYSYDREHFRPLGLQLFREKILPAPLPQRLAAGGKLPASAPHLISPAPEEAAAVTERRAFSLQSGGPGNPYTWDFDLCSLTLGNFNYRKMSLVHDYGALLEGDLGSESFDRVFSLDPKPLEDEAPPALPRREEWPVVRGDATQGAAVALARTGCSYIIQGPPGTGKSQTITNLIADYVARGKRVLFVCEKRAAIDVVFHRLRQQGLDELCCLIHDSQTDKKQFILNLKQTYESWLAEPDGADAAGERRTALLRQMEHDLEALQRFDEAMRQVPEHVAQPVRELLHRLVDLRDHEPRLSPAEAEHLPDFAVWRTHGDLARRLGIALHESTDAATLAAHPFRWLGDGVVQAERPLETLHDLTEQAEALLDEIETALGGSGLPVEHWDSLEEIEALLAFAHHLAPLAARDQLSLLDPRSPLSGSVANAATEIQKADKALAKAEEKTTHWREKLPAADVAAALEQAQAQEKSVLRFLKPSWWSLKKVLESRYDFSRHAVRPAFCKVLADLEAEHSAGAHATGLRQNATEQFAAEPLGLLDFLAPLRAPDPGSRAAAALRITVLQANEGAVIVDRLNALAPRFSGLVSVLESLLHDFRQHDLAALGELVRDLREDAEALPDLLPLLTELAEAPEAFRHALRRMPLEAPALEAAMARRSLEQVYRMERWLPRFDGRILAHRAGRIGETEQIWLAENAAVIRAEVRRRFRGHVQLAATSATQLEAEEKIFKKTFTSGRRELEHEFGKTMRYKSIRDLSAGDSGSVVRDLKPVWLMSPLSVSDTLPLTPGLFDVVIFDEASQIPVEEAVPALYRAPQVIVVGDEMQLPPTNFFTVARDGSDDVLETEEEGERVTVALDADSFLIQSAKNLPATLLAWHYRSRSESLISFSNAAFYSGNLFTIPDRSRPAPEQAEIRVHNAADAVDHCDALLARSLSFHHMAHSPYEARCNAGEAAYIATLVRELLRRETRLSLGVVAFSEAQQGEIESALEALASADPDFAARLENEYIREEEDQFCGLFVKNLENVQGDERDIIILSICYGPDAKGRMVMNFGPINQRGGEKRLNVIFSRARHHMAVVSSIRHQAITNDYNDGAAALKAYLHFAECISCGELRTARSVLEGLNPLTRKTLATTSEKDAVLAQLGEALRAKGYAVDERVGQSRFRCDLGIRAADGRHYAVGILVDTAANYANPDVAERWVTQPGILRAFGWQTLIVLTRDWYHEPHGVLDRIERLLRGEMEPAPLLEDDQPSPAPASVPPEVAESPATPPEAQAPEQETASPVKTSATRRLKFVEGPSSKFWEVTQEDCEIIIRYGRIGTQSQLLRKSFETKERASREAEKLTAEKLRKGYKDAGS